MKQRSIKGLRNAAWVLMSEFVRRRDRGICFTCGDRRDWKQQQAGHFVHKNSLDFDERNVNCQCARCNKWLHGNLTVYAMRLMEKYGKEIVNDLVVAGNFVLKLGRGEIENIIADLKRKISLLDN